MIRLYHKLIDIGAGKARQLLDKRGYEAGLQKFIDSGEAATLEEARQLQAKRGSDVRDQHMTAGDEVWVEVVVSARRTGESRRIKPREYPCPLGCGYMFTNRQNAKRHAESPTEWPLRHDRANPLDTV